MTKNERIDVVNEIIKEISSCGRGFFKGKFGVAKICYRNRRLYMINEHYGNDMCLNTKYGYPPKG